MENGCPIKHVHPFSTFSIMWKMGVLCRARKELSESGLRFAVAALVSELEAFKVCH
jgi:hypothetical protein